MKQAIYVTIVTAVTTATIATCVGICTGFWFAFTHRGNHLRHNVGLALVASRFVPAAAILPALYWMTSRLGLLDTAAGLIVANLGQAVALGVLLLTPIMAGVPVEHIEQARLEGAGTGRLFRVVIAPAILGPAMFVFLIVFAVVWNEALLASLFAETRRGQSLAVFLLSGIGEFRIRYSLLATGACISLIPMFLCTAALLLWRPRAVAERRMPPALLGLSRE